MGHRNQSGHPEVQKVIQGGIATDPALAQQYLDAGALFVAVGVGTTLLVKMASGLVQWVRLKRDCCAVGWVLSGDRGAKSEEKISTSPVSEEKVGRLKISLLAHSGRWHTASMLLPSGSITKAP